MNTGFILPGPKGANCFSTLKNFGVMVRKAISVAKKRSGRHEDTIREYKLGADGLSVGQPLANFRGIMTGTPIYEAKEPRERPGTPG